MDGKLRVLFVCTGNICRSPSAEAVVRKRAAERGMAERLDVESAGTHGWHAGQPPDPRAVDAASRRGYDLQELRARQLSRDDFEAFDLILAMDRSHHSHLLALCPDGRANKLRLFLEFAPPPGGRLDVPDPYYGGGEDFEHMLDLVERGAEGLLKALEENRVAAR